MRLFDIFKDNLRDKQIEFLDTESKKNNVITEYYKNEIQNISGKSVAGGVPNEFYNSGNIGVDWNFPFNFAITCKRMDNNADFSNIIDYYKSLITEFNWSIAYKNDDLMNDETHRRALEIMVEQFESMGGIKFFISSAIRDFLKYGLVFINPILDFKSVKFGNSSDIIPMVSHFRLLDPQGLIAMYSDENNNDKTVAVSYLSQPKAMYNTNTGSITNGNAYAQIINFNKSLSCICTLDSNGDPMGRSFLKDVWSDWRILNNMNTSFNTNLRVVGEHGYQFVPNQLFFDNHENVLTEVSKEIQKFMSGGVNSFVCAYGTLEKIVSMDLSKYDLYQKNMLDNIAMKKGLGIMRLGQSGGASRNLAQFAQADVLIRASDIAQQFAFQFSEGFIKTYFENVFAKYFFTKKLTDTPHLVFTLTEEEEILEENAMAPVQDENLASFESNSQANIVQSNNKTWIKNKLNPNEEIVINTQELEEVLQEAEKEFEVFFTKEMKRYLNDPEKIVKAIKNPLSITNGRTLTRQQEDQFIRELDNILYGIVYSFFIEESRQYEKALAVQGKKFYEEMNITKEALSARETQKILRKKGVKDFKKTQLSAFENELDNTIMNERNRLSVEVIENEELAKAQLTESLGQIKGRDFKALAPIATIAVFDSVNNHFIEKTKNDGMMLIRSGILENQCDHCNEYMGVEYYWSGLAWVGKMPYKKLPDSECYGKGRCRCFYIKVPMNEIRAMNEYK